jgi:Sugar-transfer associated ATP-grasp
MGTALLKARKRVARHFAGLVSAWNDAGTIAARQNVSRLPLLAEGAALMLGGKMALDTYFHYRFFDPAVEDKKSYLPEAPRANARMWAKLTPPMYRCLYENKYVFNRFFTGMNLPVAKLYGVFDERDGFTADGKSLCTAAELDALMTTLTDGFVFKPVEGIRGHLTLVFRAPRTTLAGEVYTAQRIVDESRQTTGLAIQNKDATVGSFMVEERLRPHRSLAALIGPTFCTLRMLTIIGRDGQPRLHSSVFKLQGGNSGVDHLRFGAVAAHVDLVRGTLGKGRTRTTFDWITKIPGNDREFVGYRLPMWEETKELALKAALAFPWARAIGWDIGITDDGPVLVEGNDRWSPSLSQLPAPHGLMCGELDALLH